MARLPVEVGVDVTGDDAVKNLAGDFDNLDKIGTGAMERIGHKITDFATGIISSGVSALVDNIGNSITLASDKAEAASKANILFGDSYGLIAQKSATAATDVGLSSGKYLELAGTLGNLTTNLGFAGDEAAVMSSDLLTLAADMGSFNNASPEDVVYAIGAAFRGETEPIRQYGVFLDDARIKAEAVSLGLYDGVGALDANAKAQAVYSLITQQTTAAQGDFARTSTGLANQQRIAAAQQEEAWTALGEALLPIALTIGPLVTLAIQAITGVLKILADNLPVVLGFLTPLGVVIAATVVPPFLAWAAATIAATWPLIAIGAAVGALFFALDKLGILRIITDLFGQFAGALRGPVDFAIGLIQKALDALRPVFDIVGKAVGALGDVFRKVFDFVLNVVVKPWLAGLQTVFRVVQDAFNTIQAALAKVGAFFKSIFDGIASTVRGAIDSVLGIFRGLLDGIVSSGRQLMAFLGGLFQPLFDSVNKVVNLAKDIWNGFVRFWNGFEIRIPAIKVADFQITPELVFGLPDLPHLASGGIITGPTLALLGEGAHDEAVVPLDGRHGLGGVTVNIYTGVGDPVAIGREVRLALDAYERASGTV